MKKNWLEIAIVFVLAWIVINFIGENTKIGKTINDKLSELLGSVSKIKDSTSSSFNEE